MADLSVIGLERRLVVWANTFPNAPRVRYGALPPDRTALALRPVSDGARTRRDILGGLSAEYRFRLLYRMKPGGSDDKRLEAGALLRRFALWASDHLPALGEGFRAVRVEAMGGPEIEAAYENGDEDHGVLMKLTYERME